MIKKLKNMFGKGLAVFLASLLVLTSLLPLVFTSFIPMRGFVGSENGGQNQVLNPGGPHVPGWAGWVNDGADTANFGAPASGVGDFRYLTTAKPPFGVW